MAVCFCVGQVGYIHQISLQKFVISADGSLMTSCLFLGLLLCQLIFHKYQPKIVATLSRFCKDFWHADNSDSLPHPDTYLLRRPYETYQSKTNCESSART